MKLLKSNASSHLDQPVLRAWFICLLFAGSWSNASNADNRPAIVADLPVTHSLVSMVTGDIERPVLLIKGAASPHDYSLRPSEAQRLASADLVFWTSRELTPWLSRTLDNNRQPVQAIELMAAPQTIRLGYREGSRFDHGHDHGSPDHDSDHKHEDGHAALVDPHGWLDPVNAIYWLGVIADALSELDPSNESKYQQNANTAKRKLEQLIEKVSLQLKPVSGSPFVVFHDSYHYFEQRFDIHAQAAIALGDAELPGIRRMNTLKQRLRQSKGVCVFTEPQFSDKIVNSLTRGMQVSMGSLDPLGATLQPGPALYIGVIQNIADELSNCLAA
ncbi:MAG: zinc ABC transporter substrate-binding protein [Granulosicoccus sp.]